MLDRLQRGKIADAADLVRLVNILHPKSACALAVKESNDVVEENELISAYVKTMASEKIKERMNLALGKVLEKGENSDVKEERAMAQ